MDLAKIIGELRLQLQCLDAAIASMEELARVQNIPDSGAREEVPAATDASAEEPPPAKRRRGRPRKNPVPDSESPQPTDSSTPPDDDSTESAA
jgi:hypothetical protein